MSAVVGSERKSLMLDKVEYDRLSAFAKKARVARPVVVTALLDLVDVGRLEAKLLEARAEQKVEATESRKKRAMLSDLADQLTPEQIQALLDKIQPK